MVKLKWQLAVHGIGKVSLQKHKKILTLFFSKIKRQNLNWSHYKFKCQNNHLYKNVTPQFKYKILGVYSDQSLGAAHSFLYEKEEKIITI